MAEPSAGRDTRRLRIVRWLRDHEARLVAVLAVTVVALTFGGYAFNPGVRARVSLPSAIYHSLASLAGGVEWDEYGWQGNLSTWLDLLLVAWVAVKAAMLAFANAIDGAWARRRRGHTILCGIGHYGRILSEALLRSGSKLTIIEPDRANPDALLLRAQGACVLIGDPTGAEALDAARADRATRVICMMDSDDANAVVAREVARLVPAGTPACFIRNESPSTWASIDSARDNAVVPFSVLSSASSNVFLAIDLESLKGDVDIAVFGTGVASESVIVRAAKVWQAIAVRRGGAGVLRLHVVGPDGGSFVSRVLPLRYDGIDALCELVGSDVDSWDVAEHVAACALEGAESLAAAVVATGRDTANVQLALALARRAPDTIRIVAVTDTRPGVLELVASADSGLAARLDIVDVSSALRDSGTVLGGTREEMARLAHEDWLRTQLRHGAELDSRGPMQHWSSLPESFKQSNREQMRAVFDAMVPRLASTVVPLADWDARPFEFRRGEVEALSRLEHERWCAERTAAGWRLDASLAERDARTKRTPWLVSYDDLPDVQKDNDRDAVTRIPVTLARAGFRLQRNGDSAGG